MGCQGVSQIDTANFWQLVTGKPVQKRRCAGPFDNMFAKRRRINQANTFTDRFGFIHSILPPATTAERAGIMVKVICGIKRAIVVGPLPTVHKAKLCTTCLLALIRWRRAQRATRRALFVRVVQNINVIIAFFVFARGKFCGHPVGRITLGIKACHVDLGFALNHHLRKVIAGTTSSRDAKAKAFRKPHIVQSWCWPNERVSVWRIANRAVEIVFQTAFLTRRNTMNHSHILLFDTVQCERK